MVSIFFIYLESKGKQSEEKKKETIEQIEIGTAR
jgi:hypothetical protein